MLKLIKRKILSYKNYIERAKVNKEFASNNSKVSLPPEALIYEKKLRENGVVKISGLFDKEVEYINEEYFSKINGNQYEIEHWFKNVLNERTKRNGRTVSLNISFSDQNLTKLFFNPELLGIVYNYFGRQPFYRNLPGLSKVEYTDSHGVDIQGKFHLDGGMNQVSFMLLLNDIDENDTHMQYALKTNNQKLPIDIDRFSWEDKKISNQYDIYNLVGKKGDLFIFDAGNGYHRAVYKKNSVRKILHLNLTRGHSLVGHKEADFDSFNHIEDKEEFVKKSIEKLL